MNVVAVEQQLMAKFEQAIGRLSLKFAFLEQTIFAMVCALKRDDAPETARKAADNCKPLGPFAVKLKILEMHGPDLLARLGAQPSWPSQPFLDLLDTCRHLADKRNECLHAFSAYQFRQAEGGFQIMEPVFVKREKTTGEAVHSMIDEDAIRKVDELTKRVHEAATFGFSNYLFKFQLKPIDMPDFVMPV